MGMRRGESLVYIRCPHCGSLLEARLMSVWSHMISQHLEIALHALSPTAFPLERITLLEKKVAVANGVGTKGPTNANTTLYKEQGLGYVRWNGCP